ncbi:unnamed protein product [Phyllotreta striolata]|uniref:Uncharacterized protein n=1 Tax=Phyllotreta striolata TaxID=444603 RepID=A0A9N9TNN3_PHYSR|nr:unnamed protein product [Phyllotreta striolata]
MSAEQMNENVTSITDLSPTCMESVNRFSKLPMVDCTIKTATSLYEKVKDYNSVTNWTFSTAESTVNKAVEVGKPIATPVIKNFEGPIKKVDSVLCSGLDYIETTVPAVKLPPAQIYNSTRNYVTTNVSPAYESAKTMAEPAVKTAMDFVEPVYERAKSAVEPAVERAKTIVEPLVQPALDKANAIKDNVMHKVEEILNQGHNHEEFLVAGQVLECEECQEIRKKAEEDRHTQSHSHE